MERIRTLRTNRRLETLLVDYREPSPEFHAGQMELRKALRHVLASLTPLRRKVLEMRFGLLDGYCYSGEEIGLLLRCTRNRVYGIEAMGLAYLQSSQRLRILQPFRDRQPINEK